MLHRLPSDDLLHGHFHLLAVEGVLPVRGAGRGEQTERLFRPKGEGLPWQSNG